MLPSLTREQAKDKAEINHRIVASVLEAGGDAGTTTVGMIDTIEEVVKVITATIAGHIDGNAATTIAIGLDEARRSQSCGLQLRGGTKL